MKNADVASLKLEARSMKLVYSTDSSPGYSRLRKGRYFVFFDTEGKRITDKDEIARIKSLALPPAWKDVWICPKPNGHLQATGHDTLGRKQYKYHSKWSLHRNERKHNHMLDFAKALPNIRKKVEEDLSQKEFSKEKVVALAIAVMDKTFIRVGNSAYTKMYGSFGLTSLRNRHIKISGNKMIIAFKGKKGVFQEVALTHARLSRMLKKLKDIPGQELFQFYDTDGSRKSIDSECINQYIETCTGMDFTAKDFRTWWGTVTAAGFLAETVPVNSDTEAQKNIIAALDLVAKKLGNTRSVCKKYYVHPALLVSYQEGKLQKFLPESESTETDNKEIIMNPEEKMVVKFMENECKAA
ncbi:MAG: topoisomerase [Bacteroidota bacterium]|nr:topoisomerase [Bacteroidota bacterium]